MWNDIKNKKRIHNQKTFGDIKDFDPKLNVCGIAMCTGGMWVDLGGKPAYDFKNKYGYALTSLLMHKKAHPTLPCQDFGTPTQESAEAYIEWMALNEEDINE